jgi:hypothetical protein
VLRPNKVLTTLAIALLLTSVTPVTPGAAVSQPQPAPGSIFEPDDWDAPVVADTRGADTTQGLFDEDPTGLIPKTPFVQRYSLDQDHWEVWLCGNVTHTMPQVLAALEAATVDYYDSLSGGVYEPIFTAGGTKPLDATCLDGFLNGTYSPVGSPEGLLIIDSVTGGGYASPGTICISSDPDCGWIGSTFPDNYRYAVVGENSAMNWPSVTAHELGHTLQWPHSNSGTGDEYDNPIDLMSGNNTTGGWTEANPYATLSYNRFQSGWVSTSDVVVADGTYQAVTLRPHDVAGTQLFAIKTAQPGRFYVFGTRIASAYDPIPSAWQGVEVYEVDYYCDDGAFGGGICPGIYRDHTQQPPSPDGLGHVLQLGESVTLEGLTVTVTGATATGYTITSDPNPGVDTEPSAPGVPAVAGGNAEIHTSWTAPGDDGGATVTNYELHINDITAATYVYADAGSGLSEDVTGLTNGHSYRIRVRAENSFGVGAWSGWSAQVTLLWTPGAPQQPKITVTAVGEAAASWLAPLDNGGTAVTGYEVVLENTTGGAAVTYHPGTAMTLDITGLSEVDTYRYRVRAENSEGWGLWSAWSPDFIPGLVPSAPGVPTVSAGDEQMAVSWGASGGLGSAVDTYELELEDVSSASSVTVAVGGTTLSRVFAGLVNGDDYRVRVRAHNDSGWGPWSAWSETTTPQVVNTFIDDDGSVFEADIEWLAAEGVTRGCNPPINDMFCPAASVTRGQMAAFLTRALGLTDQLADPFTDDDDSVFEADIEKLAAAGITRGCNPPANDMFCPAASVTRGQMAAFLVRALGYSDAGPGDLFVDDDGSIFEGAIDRLAVAGITRGCNPPANDMFCPAASVTRGQMAAFLHRALG